MWGIKLTEVTEVFRKIGVFGSLKFITIQCAATTATSYTIDLDSDVTDGKGLVMTQILNTLAQDDVGADVDGTFDPATGIYTFGTLSTGIHNITFIGY